MKIVCTADLHLGNYPYGRFDPKTGLDTRFQDLLNTLDKIVDKTLKDDCGGLIIAGDVFKDGNPSQTVVREFIKRVKRILDAGKFVLIVVGNHPKGASYGLAYALEPFHILGTENLWIVSEIKQWWIKDPAYSEIGVNVVTVPYYYSHEKSTEEIKKEILKTVGEITNKQYPTILVGHFFTNKTELGVYGGQPNQEEQEMVLDVAFLKTLKVDAMVVGHPHRSQYIEEINLIHPGSPDRISFGEEKEPKRFVVLDTDNIKEAEIVDTHARRFVTYEIKVDKPDIKLILDEVDPVEIAGAIVRLKLEIPEDVFSAIDLSRIYIELNDCFYLKLDLTVVRVQSLATMEFEDSAPDSIFKKYMESYEGKAKKKVLESGLDLIEEV